MDFSVQLMNIQGGDDVIEITPTTWNPNDKATFMVLSDGNLTAERTFSNNAYQAVRSVAHSPTAKWYWETNQPNKDYMALGIANASLLLSGINDPPHAFVGATVYRREPSGGKLYSEGVEEVIGLPTSFIVLMFAVDLENSKIWLGSDGSWWNSGDPSGGTNPTFSGFPVDDYYIVFSLSLGLSIITADFGQNPTYSAPAGFTATG